MRIAARASRLDTDAGNDCAVLPWAPVLKGYDPPSNPGQFNERTILAQPLDQLSDEIASPQPHSTRVALAWQALQGFAAIEGAWQGWERVQHLAASAAPLVEQWLRALPQ